MTIDIRAFRAFALGAVLVAALCIAMPVSAHADESMHRLYNPNSGEHFYTASEAERDHLVSLGWSYEGVGWTAPESSSSPVHRLYNPNAGDHHYTTSEGERDMLVSVGWRYEGIGWYSDDALGVALYRQYNPNAAAGSHNYTTSVAENDMLVSVGWKAEGVGWYGVAPPASGGQASGGSGLSSCDHEWVEETGTVTVVDEPAWREKVGYSIFHCNVCGENISMLDYMSVEQIKEMNEWIQSDKAQAMSQRDRLRYVADTWLIDWDTAIDEHNAKCNGNTSIWDRYTYLEHPAVTHTETKTTRVCSRCGATE